MQSLECGLKGRKQSTQVREVEPSRELTQVRGSSPEELSSAQVRRSLPLNLNC
jgi:hypothetical protein